MTDRPSAAETVIKDVSSMRWPGEPPDDSAELARRAEALAAQLGVDDLDALTDRLVSLRKARRKEEPRPRRRYDLPGALPEDGLQAMPLDPDDALSLAWGRKPRKAPASWGLSGRYVRVNAEEPFSFARIRFALPLSRLRHLYPGTVVAARWDPAAERFRLIPASGYSETGEYLYAQITRPGLFTAIGLPRDPRALLALRLLASLAPWAQASAYGGAPIAQPMLEALLSQPLLRQFKDDAALRETYGYRRRDFPLSDARLDALDFSGGRIDAVLDRLPELDLLDVLDDPNRMVKPVPDPRLPEEWPLPRHRWQSLGPANVTGRIKALAIHPEDGDVLYAGAAGGGVWKTVNGGRDWFPTMHDERSLAIGGLAIAPSAPEVLYAATGEWTGNDDRPETPSGMGAGVYRTSDGGGHWELCAPIESFLCTSVSVDPRNADRVFVGGNRGLHLSEDGGLSWRNVAVADGKTDRCGGTVTSIVMAHDEPDRIYVGIHGHGVYRSVDGGVSWRLILTSSPKVEAIAPKIALGRRGVSGSRFVAVKTADIVLTSDDAGERFVRMADTDDWSRSMVPWCSTIAVHPSEQAVLLAGSKNLCRSTDGGKSWTRVAGYGTPVHEDQQAAVFLDHPGAPVGGMLLATDGGIFRSLDSGATWRPRSTGLCAGQVYDVAVADGPTLRCAATFQDYDAHVYEGVACWTELPLGEEGSVHFVPGCCDLLDAVSRWTGLTRLQRTLAGDWSIVAEGPDIRLRARHPLAYSKSLTAIVAIDASGRALVREPKDDSLIWPTVLAAQSGRFVLLIAIPNDRGDSEWLLVADDSARLYLSYRGGPKWSLLDPANRRGVRWQAADIGHPATPQRVYLSGIDRDGSTVERIDIEGHSLVRVGLRRTNQQFEMTAQRMSASAVHPRLTDTIITLDGEACLRSIDAGWSWHSCYSPSPRGEPMKLARSNYYCSAILASHGTGIYLWAL